MTIDWKPIEKMPDELKDGRTVLLWCPTIESSYRPFGMINVAAAVWTRSGWLGADGEIDQGWESTGPYFEHETYAPSHYAEITPPS